MAAWVIAGPAVAQEPPKNFVPLDEPKVVAAITFHDGEGHARSLADFKGKIVLLNIWAVDSDVVMCVPVIGQLISSAFSHRNARRSEPDGSRSPCPTWAWGP